MSATPPLCACGCGQSTKPYTRTNVTKGHIVGVYAKYVHGHTGRIRNNAPGWSAYKVENRGHETPCWVWKGCLDNQGYGKFLQGSAHRRFYERYKGSIPQGLHIDHLCEVKACVNPEHLEAVTHAENNRRGKRTKLTATHIRDIRASDNSYAELGRQFGVSGSTIRDIKVRKTWKDVT